MPRLLLALIAVCALATADALFVFETDTRSLAGEEWTSDFDICFVGAGFAVGSGNPSAGSVPRFASVIDPSFRSFDDYAIAHISSPEGLLSAGRLGDILVQREGVAFVRVSSPISLGGPLPGIHMVQPARSIELAVEQPLILSDQDGMDDYISDMVAAVSESGFQGNIQHLQDYLTRHSSTDGYDSAASWVETTFEGFGIDAELQYFSMGGYDCENVIAEKPGLEDSTRIVVICGHLDSTSPSYTTNAPGADDNASGSAVVIEAARIMSGYDFKYTIRFICFGGEEQGLIGSDFYAGQAASAGDDIVAVVNLDMVLYGPTGQDIMWVPYNSQSTGLALALDAICDTYVPALDVFTEYSPGTTYSDHSSFWNEGYAAVLGIEQEVFSNPYYHQTSDILSNYMTYFPFGTNCAKGSIATVAYLAEPMGPTGIEGDDPIPGTGGVRILSAGPNPASGSLSVELTDPVGEFAWGVYDLSGRTVTTGVGGYSEGSVTIDVSSLPAGVFMLRIDAGGSSDTARFAIVR